MLVHSVFFWLKSDADKAAFRAGLDTLRDIECASAVYVGAPADAGDRPVIERSYSFALTVLFESTADHDAYQVHRLHQAFLDKCADMWEKVVVYDAE